MYFGIILQIKNIIPHLLKIKCNIILNRCRSSYLQDRSVVLFGFTPAENPAAVFSWSHKIFLIWPKHLYNSYSKPNVKYIKDELRLDCTSGTWSCLFLLLKILFTYGHYKQCGSVMIFTLLPQSFHCKSWYCSSTDVTEYANQ